MVKRSFDPAGAFCKGDGAIYNSSDMRRLVPLASLLALALLLVGGRVHADGKMYEWEDKDGVVHFSNVKPPRATGAKVFSESGPGRGQVVGGSSYAGCRVSRADVVPARDRSPERYSRYDEIIAEAADLYAIPEALIRAVIRVESDYDPRVVSCAGARGLMQIMPYEEKSQRIDNVFDPRENILAGARLLRLNANRFKGDLVSTVAAYHAGVGAVEKYGGVPPYATTRQYVQMVTAQYARYRARELAPRPGDEGGAPTAQGQIQTKTTASVARN